MDREQIYLNVGIWIKNEAARRNLTLRDFAIKRLQTNPSYLSQVIRGLRKPGRKLVLKFIDLGMDRKILGIYDGLDVDTNTVSVNELVMIIKEQRNIIDNQSMQIRNLAKTVQSLMKQHKNLAKPE